MLDDYPLYEVQKTFRRAWILEHAKVGGTCAEFGVFRGHFSEVIARVLAPETLYLVDPWTTGATVFEWGDHPHSMKLTRNNTLTTKEAMEETRARVARYPAVKLVEQTLEDFCRGYTGKPLDMAYLDTSHTYDDTVLQLDLIASILAPDGLICGDDWEADPAHPHHGVFRAVNEFVKKTEFQFVAAGPDNQFCIRR